MPALRRCARIFEHPRQPLPTSTTLRPPVIAARRLTAEQATVRPADTADALQLTRQPAVTAAAERATANPAVTGAERAAADDATAKPAVAAAKGATTNPAVANAAERLTAERPAGDCGCVQRFLTTLVFGG